MKIQHKLIIYFMSLSTSLFGQKSYDLYQPDNESKTYIARDYICLHQGYSFNNAGGKTLYLGIDEQIIDSTSYQSLSQIPNPNRSIDTGYAVGTIAGEASASLTGAAVYQIPIEVMPGTGGMQPNVSIVYNSQSGNGLVGYGWSLGAVSAITRVGKTIYHDDSVGVPDLTTSDNLMLDGQRLMRASGTNLAASSTYKTEIETNLDITCKTLNSYLGFEVKNKEGWTLEYGSSADSYIKPKGSSATYAWLLKKVTDTNGNYMTYTYDNNSETGEFRLKQIDYTGNDAAGLNAYNKIEFCYETRTDQSVSYIAGSSVQQSVILRKIKCSAYGSTIKDYRFNYYFDGIYSKLTEVEEYGQNGIRYNSTVIDWGDYNGDYSRHTSEEYASLSDIKEGTYPIYADFNGDGKTDFISYAEKSPNTSYTSSDVATLYLASTANGVISFIKQGTIPLISGFNKFYTGDFNGDGNMDIVREYTQNNKFYYTFYTFNGSQFVQGNTIETGSNKMVQTGDYNGDGKDEIFFLSSGYSGTVYDLNKNLISSFQFPSSYGGNTDCEMYVEYFLNSKIDINGNGKTDILLGRNYFCSNPPLSMCVPCTKSSRVWIEGYELDSNNNFVKIVDQDAGLSSKIFDESMVFVGDFNGDGKQDILCRNDDNNAQTTSLDIYFSTGTSFEKKTLSNLGLKPNFPIVSISDFNNDGKSDFVYFFSDSQNKHFTYIYTSTGDNFVSESYPSTVLIPSEVIQDTKTVSIGDFDGDGRNELIYAKWNNQSYIQTFNDKQNLQVKNIIDGLDRKITFDYKPITDNGYYTESVSSYTFPVSKFRQPLYVVTAINTANGSLNSQNGYSYKNARVHRQGKGFLGFEEIKTISNPIDRSIITQYGYNPTYFNIYTVKQTVTTTEGDSISRTDFGNDLYTTSLAKVIFPYVNSQNTVDKLTGITKNTDYTYISSDEGNPNKITETQGSSVTETSYVWEAKNSAHKNRVTQQVINKKGIGATFSETKNFEYDAKAQLTKKIDYSGNAKAVTTEYSNYDNFGNPLKVTTTATNCPAVTASSTFDGTGRFETTHTNTLGNISTASYDPNTGVLLNQTDIAGLKTMYQYDDFQKLIQKANLIDDINYATAWDISGDNLYRTDVTSKIKGQQTTWYNAAGLEKKTQSPGFSGTVVSEKEYNSNGQLYRSYLPDYGSKSSQYVEYAYDVFGRISKEINLGRTTSYSYSGLTTTITAPDGTTKSSTLNLSGLVESSKDAANNAVTYTYNSLGKQETVTSNGVTTSITYDDRGFQQTLKDANLLNPVQYVYDAYGQLSSQTNARGKTTSFQYDAAGRMTQESNPERTLTYQYVASGNGIGQIQTIKQDNAIVRSYGYTSLGQLSSVAEKIDGTDYTTSYVYNDYGQIQEQQSPSGMRVSYQYNNGLLTSMRKADNNALLWQLNAANALGQITESTMGNGLKRVSEYDSYYLPNQIQLKDGTSIIDQVSYSFNANTGNLTSRNDVSNGRNETFGYDNLNRLTSIILNGGTTNSITYSPNGNINTKFDVGTYQYANGNHAVSGITNQISSYNPPALDITNTSYNRVSTLIQQGSTVKELDFQYNSDKQRNKSLYYENSVLKKTMYYVGNYEKEVINGGSTKEYDYIYTPEGLTAISVKTDGTSSLYYVQTDHLGSIRLVTNASKGIQTCYYYDAWGKQTLVSGTSITNRGYIGEEHLNDFGLINLNARLYDPVLGRFMGMDPYVSMPDFTQSYNRYGYGMNNPLKYTDPDGENPFIILAGFLLAKWFYDGVHANNGQLNPFKWDYSQANFVVGYSSQGNVFSFGSGWNNSYSIALGYNSSQGFGFGYSYNENSFLYYPNYNYNAPEQAVNKGISQARESWNYSAFSTASIASAAILADDVTGIGTVDDAVIPFVYVGATGVFLYQNRDQIAKMTREIAGVVERNLTLKNGFTYELVAANSGYYPNVRGGSVYLNAGDVWKYGETTRDDRYAQKYLDNTGLGLKMNPVYFGNQMQIKIHEKILIYNYFFQNGTLPPGNKIFR